MLITFNIEFYSHEVLKRAKKLANKGEFSGAFMRSDRPREGRKRSKEYSQKAKKGKHYLEPESTTAPPLPQRSGMLSYANVRLKITYPTADGLVVNGEE